MSCCDQNGCSSSSTKQNIIFILSILSAILISDYLNITDLNSISFLQSILPNFLLSYLYIQHADSHEKKVHLDAKLNTIFEKLKNLADQPLEKYKVAVGFGSCVDIFTDAVPLFEKLNIEAPPKNTNPEHYKVIKNKKELSSGFSYFFIKGAASERYISNEELFDLLVENVDQKSAKFALGGNAPVMANRFAKEGRERVPKKNGEVDIILAAQFSSEFEKDGWMDEKVRFTGPRTEVADRHLILEYKQNEKFNHLVSPRANRFIVHSDSHNPYLRGIDENFTKNFIKMQPNLLVISGLQMMDNIPYTTQQRTELIKKISNFCQEHRAVKTHFELASFVDNDLVNEIIKEVIPFSDSIGCNEQELPNIYAALTGKELITVADSMPKVSNILDILRQTFQILNRPDENGRDTGRKTSRIHVHTLAYQMIVQIDDQETESRWPNIKKAAAKATVTAVRHICQNDAVTAENIKILLDNSFSTSNFPIDESSGNPKRIFIDPEEPVVCWTENDPIIKKKIKFCLSVGLVCTAVKQTAGGGDNISAGALAAQLP